MNLGPFFPANAYRSTTYRKTRPHARFELSFCHTHRKAHLHSRNDFCVDRPIRLTGFLPEGNLGTDRVGGKFIVEGSATVEPSQQNTGVIRRNKHNFIKTSAVNLYFQGNSSNHGGSRGSCAVVRSESCTKRNWYSAEVCVSRIMPQRIS